MKKEVTETGTYTFKITTPTPDIKIFLEDLSSENH